MVTITLRFDMLGDSWCLSWGRAIIFWGAFALSHRDDIWGQGLRGARR
jgi:hypothetical protein